MDWVTWWQRYEAGNIGSRTVKLTVGGKCDTIGLIKIYLRLRSLENFPEQKEMTKADFVIICGDFGFWDESGEQWNVDVIVSHCCAFSIQQEVCGDRFEKNELTEYFELIMGRCEFGKWLFGHYHENRNVGKRLAVLYEQIVRGV